MDLLLNNGLSDFPSEKYNEELSKCMMPLHEYVYYDFMPIDYINM